MKLKKKNKNKNYDELNKYASIFMEWLKKNDGLGNKSNGQLPIGGKKIIENKNLEESVKSL